MKKAIDFFNRHIIAHPAWFFLAVALLWVGILSFLNYIFRVNVSLNDLLVEARGMVFDLLVFGVLLSIYERLREKRDKIERLHEEIDDYRGWDEKEATFRIVGAVKRLKRPKKLDVTKIDLSQCYLKEAQLYGINLQGGFLAKVNLQKAYLEKASLRDADLHWANLEEANLDWADLKGALLSSANLQGASLKWAKLQEAHLDGANLQKAQLQSADLTHAKLVAAQLKEAELHGVILWHADLSGAFMQGADLWGAKLEYANFQGTVLWDAKLDGAVVGENWFEKLKEWKVMGREEIMAKYLIDENGVLREKQ